MKAENAWLCMYFVINRCRYQQVTLHFATNKIDQLASLLF